MSSIVIKLNAAGVSQLLKKEIRPLLEEKAREIASRCGDGYEYDSYEGQNRCNAMVWADTPDAKIDNEQNNTILGALR